MSEIIEKISETKYLSDFDVERNPNCELCGGSGIIHYNARYFMKKQKELVYPCPHCHWIIHPGKILNYIKDVRHSVCCKKDGLFPIDEKKEIWDILAHIERKIRSGNFNFD